MTIRPGDRPLYRWERLGLVLVGLAVVGFGVLTEIRSCFLKARHTDFGMLARAGWAVRTGGDIYQVTDNGGLHYPYLAAFSVVMVPFADPPAGADHTGYLPFAVSVAAWYLISVALLFGALHAFAAAALPDAKSGTRRWWYARAIPFYVCLGGIGFSLGRGQVTILLIALIAASFAETIRGRRYGAGAWLGTAIAIKMIPAYLLLYPLVRRDWRFGLGVAAAMVVMLGVIPVAVWGPAGALEKHRYVLEHVVMAGTTGEGGDRLNKELTLTTATHSLSFQSVLHNVRNYDQPRHLRPNKAESSTRLTHWGIAAVLSLVVLIAALRRMTDEPTDQLVVLGCLSALMMLITPVSHVHYLAFALPLAAGLWLRGLAQRPGQTSAGFATTAALSAWAIVTVPLLIPGPPFDQIREYGVGTLATVALCGFGLRQLGRGWEVEQPAVIPLPLPLRHAA